jgi:hypothetical protein
VAGESWSFDAEVGSGSDPTAGGAVSFELPPDLQQTGTLWPTPAGQVSDHSAEGAPWVPAAGTIGGGYGWEFGPPGGGAPPKPEFVADHGGPSVPYDAAAAPWRGQAMAAQPGWSHDGADGDYWNPGDDGPAGSTAPNAWALVNIGAPFTVDQGSTEHRTLATDQWDPTGKRVNPADAPSAPHELYGSQHYTRPRLTPYELPALFDWAWAQGQQFQPGPPGYWEVSANPPNLAPRPQGAVAAQMPSDPYVASAVPGSAAPAAPDYSWDF